MGDKMNEVELLKDLKSNLEKEVKELKIQKSNLEADVHTLQIKQEGDRKSQELDIKRKSNLEKEKNIQEINRLKILQSQVDYQSQRLKDRVSEVEKREQELIDLDKRKLVLKEERDRFNMYKVQVAKDVEKAKITIAEADAREEAIQSSLRSIEFREQNVLKQEKYWNDKIGELEANIKQFNIERENFFSDQKEEIHVT